jgi:putative tryptophan/tyrosine transport system substrate-binding protein
MHFGRLRRREFITLLGGAAAWPLVAQAQAERVRRVGLLHAQSSNDPERQASVAVFRQALGQLGWTEGRNIQFEYRWSGGNAAETRKFAAELIALAPDVLLTSGAAPLAPLAQGTRNIPIVFVLVADPVGAGFVDSLARPGGNVTGFMAQEYGFSGKYPELLKEIAPNVKRAAVIRDPAISAGIGLFGAVQSAASSLGMEVVPVNVRDAGEIERAITDFAKAPGGGLIVTASALAFVHRDLIISLAARYKLPGLYPARAFVASGGLFTYGPSNRDQYRRAASYVDRILRGEKLTDLPVQAQTAYELIINLRTAKALGLEIPPMLLARADEVIE